MMQDCVTISQVYLVHKQLCPVDRVRKTHFVTGKSGLLAICASKCILNILQAVQRCTISIWHALQCSIVSQVQCMLFKLAHDEGSSEG